MRHELHLIRAGLRALAIGVVPMVGFGVAFAGWRGAVSAAAGAALIALNQTIAALSTGWSRRLTTGTLSVGYAGFALRMFGVFAAFTVAASTTWIHRGLFAAAFVLGLALTLGAEWVSYTRKTYVPKWRMAR